MAYKIVGADENSNFPPRVEAQLAVKFTNETFVTTTASNAQTAATAASKTYTDTKISELDTTGLIEDPEDPGFFING